MRKQCGTKNKQIPTAPQHFIMEAPQIVRGTNQAIAGCGNGKCDF
jgi:hypothetical protein